MHARNKTIEETLVETINDACVRTPGRLLIPAFSIGRTQALVYSLNNIFSKGLLPPVKVFVDSPLALRATDIYRKYDNLLNEDSKEFYRAKGDEFEFDNLSYVQDMNESKAISNYFEPCIIVSSAGMLEGGRIQDHLFYNIQNYYCTILFIGYCAKGTLGHRLLRGDPVVNIRNRELSVYATIKKTDTLSGHADHQDLVDLVKNQDKDKLKKIFLVHGEESSMLAMKVALENEAYPVLIPEKGESFYL